MNQEPALSVSDLSVGFSGGDRPVVLFTNLNLDLYPGQLVCLMGPNGIGKSTLLRTLAGLQQPVAGTLPPANAKAISVVLTDKVTSTNMSVYDLVCYGRYPYLDWALRLSDDDKKIIDTSLALTHLNDIADRPIHELSDGQMQMAMIARALAQDTPILLLDEPTAHLDLNNRVEMMNLLRSLARSTGKAVLLASHELDLALQTSDMVWLATRDKKIKTGIPEDLVLDGSFDEVFRLKGYDLKTGKVSHRATRGILVNVKGEGHTLMWTRNALERNGFGLSEIASLTVQIEDGKWRLREKTYDSLEELLKVMTAG